jgi:HEAT repeat protein
MFAKPAIRRRPRPRREDEIIAALRSEPSSVKRRRELVRDLGRSPTSRSLDVLRENALSSDHKVSVGALFGLRRLGTEEAWDVVIECLAIAPVRHLWLAIDMLGKAGIRSAIPALIQCLDRRREELRRGDRRLIVLAFIRMPHRSEVPVLERTLREPGYRLRDSAAVALAQIRAPESRAALEVAAREFSWLRGRTVRRALRQRRRTDDAV